MHQYTMMILKSGQDRWKRDSIEVQKLLIYKLIKPSGNIHVKINAFMI